MMEAEVAPGWIFVQFSCKISAFLVSKLNTRCMQTRSHEEGITGVSRAEVNRLASRDVILST
jgi:hypothetical protein